MGIRVTQVRNADLNLLVYFTVLAEERSLTRAAKRLFLTQPSMTRALQKLRDLFADDLLIRTSTEYGLTPKGEALLREVSQFLPRLDRLISGSNFDPYRESAHFRVAATDNASALYGPTLAKLFASWNRVSFSFRPWTDEAHDDLERGRIDLLLNAEDGSLSPHLEHEILFHDRFVCVVSKDSPFKNRMTLKAYLAAHHIGVSVLGGRQTIPERLLTQLGVKRHCVISVPYFTVALRMVADTPLVLSVPRRLAESTIDRQQVKILNPPSEFQGFRYLMAWHPRHDSDAQNQWLRQLFRDATSSIPA
jgi:DNA-binding transcriptional LysR family regulator